MTEAQAIKENDRIAQYLMKNFPRMDWMGFLFFNSRSKEMLAFSTN